MKPTIEIFESDQFGQIRTTTDQSGNPLFCLKDVCSILSIQNHKDIKARLDDDGVDSIYLLTQRGSQKVIFINEPNLYRCIFSSRKKEAKLFQNWVFDVVLPSIRNTGSYAINNEISLLKQENEALKQRLNIIENYYANTNIKKQLKSTYKVAKMLGFNKVKEFCQLLDYVGIIIYWNNEVILTPKYDNPEYAEYVTWWKGKRKIEYVNWTEKGINAIVQELGLEIQK